MADRLSAAQVDEWSAFERRFGPILIHERIDIGLAIVAKVSSGADGPLTAFLPTWWHWLEEEEEDTEADEAGMMIATMRAMSEKWRRKREAEEVSDGSERAGGSDNRGRDEPEARVHPSRGGDRAVRGRYAERIGSDEGGDR